MEKNSRCWYNLNLGNDHPLKEGFVWPNVGSDVLRKEFFYSVPSDVLSPALIEQMESIGAPFTSVILFWRRAGSDHEWAHIDVNAKRYVTTCAINWAYHAPNSEMIWYRAPPDDVIGSKEIHVAPGQTHSLTFKINDLEEIDRCHITNSPVLVKTNIPHTILVHGENRWSISARFGGRYQDWDAAVSAFENIGVLSS